MSYAGIIHHFYGLAGCIYEIVIRPEHSSHPFWCATKWDGPAFIFNLFLKIEMWSHLGFPLKLFDNSSSWMPSPYFSFSNQIALILCFMVKL